MKNALIAVAVLLSLATACKNRQATEVKTTGTETAGMDNSRTSVDWPGAYFGVLPCASCPGINTLIVLNEDGTYEKTEEYLESEAAPEISRGQFRWDDAGSIITLGENTYKVGENQLFALDAENNVIEGALADAYILSKTILEPEPDANEGYTLQSFSGSDNREYDIVFNTNPKVPTALVQTEGFEKILSQTESWANGAEYAGGNVTLEVRGDKGTLTVDGKKIELKERK